MINIERNLPKRLLPAKVTEVFETLRSIVVWEIIKAAGWPIWPLIIASVVALAIMGERFWALRREVVAPSNLLPEVQRWLGQGGVTKETLGKLEKHSMLGQVFASALANAKTHAKSLKKPLKKQVARWHTIWSGICLF